MNNELNAIKVSGVIEKIHVDFSSIDAMYESTGFKRFYTIHTAKTNKMSAQLGFHVGGFCDDRGSGGPDLAAKIAGYEYLPSDLILCFMDDKYNFLPLNERQLESLYVYLTTGKVVSSTVDDDAQAFFDKYQINPVLPEIGGNCDVIIPEPDGKVIVLIYDFNTDEMSDSEAFKVGENLFYYADKLVNEFENVGDVLLSPEKDYYLLNYRDTEAQTYVVLIQAIENPKEKQVLTSILDVIKDELSEQHKTEKELTDVSIEESFDEDIDDDDEMIDYVLFFKVEAEFPKSKDFLKTHYEFCYPLHLENKPKFPYFNSLFTYEGFDRINDVLSLVLRKGKQEEHIKIKLNEDYSFDFAYKTSLSNNSYREGKVTLSLHHFNFRQAHLPGRLICKNSVVIDGVASVDQAVSINNVTDDPDVEPFVMLDSGDGYGIFSIDEEAGLIIAYGFREGDEEDNPNQIYVPVWFDKPNEEYVSYSTDGHLNESINVLAYQKD